MRIAYFDCVGGVAGDMIVAALVDAGASQERVRRTLAGLGVSGFAVSFEPHRAAGLDALRFHVTIDPGAPQPHRRLGDIEDILRSSRLPAPVRERAGAVFTRLARAEARVHGCGVDEVHFHEVGAVDAIVDVVAAVTALDDLRVDRVSCSPVPTGQGTVECAHGVMPVPAPATVELLRGRPIASCDETGEMTTPTGAALVTTLASDFGPLPSMRVEGVGTGAGTRVWRSRPNILRVLLGTSDDEPDTDEIVVLEANLDDVPAQVIAYGCERLLAEGALDVFTVPITMKKSRPGVILTVLCEPGSAGQLERIMFEETPTLGVRRSPARRSRLPRRFESVETPFGGIRIKIGQRDGIVSVAPEYEDCRAAARRHGVPLRSVMDAARRAWEDRTREDRA